MTTLAYGHQAISKDRLSCDVCKRPVHWVEPSRDGRPGRYQHRRAPGGYAKRTRVQRFY